MWSPCRQLIFYVVSALTNFERYVVFINNISIIIIINQTTGRQSHAPIIRAKDSQSLEKVREKGIPFSVVGRQRNATIKIIIISFLSFLLQINDESFKATNKKGFGRFPIFYQICKFFEILSLLNQTQNFLFFPSSIALPFRFVYPF